MMWAGMEGGSGLNAISKCYWPRSHFWEFLPAWPSAPLLVLSPVSVWTSGKRELLECVESYEKEHINEDEGKRVKKDLDGEREE